MVCMEFVYFIKLPWKNLQKILIARIGMLESKPPAKAATITGTNHRTCSEHCYAEARE